MSQKKSKKAAGNTKPQKEKKLTAKELKAQEEAEARELAKEREREEEELRARVEAARRQVEETLRMKQEEQNVREQLLQESEEQFTRSAADWRDEQVAMRHEEAFARYADCEKLAESSCPRQVSEYLSLWKDSPVHGGSEEVFRRVREVVTVLERVRELLEEPLDVDPERARRLGSVTAELREEMQRRVDAATFLAARRAELEMARSRLHEVHWEESSPLLSWCLWGATPLPTPARPPPEAERHRRQFEFPQAGVAVDLPTELFDRSFLVRVLWVDYDHLSDLCPTWSAPPLPCGSLLDAVLVEWKVESAAIAKRVAEIEATVASGQLSADSDHSLVQPQEAPAESLESPPKSDEAQLAEDLERLTPVLQPGELNLREYRVLGGVVRLDLLELPPQPVVLSDDRELSVLEAPLELRPLDFSPDPARGVDGMPGLQLRLPQHVLWPEAPTVASWDPRAGFWYTGDVHSSRLDDGQVSFRLARPAPTCLAARRHAGALPLREWRVSSEPGSGGVSVRLAAAAGTTLELSVHSGLVALGWTDSPQLEDLVGRYESLAWTVEALRRRGIDVFPEQDAALYVPGACPKHRAAVEHVYQSMAAFCVPFVFESSPWNRRAGLRTMALRFKEQDTDSFSTAVVTPLSAALADDRQSLDALPGQRFQPDLLHLLRALASPAALEDARESPPRLVGCVADLLRRAGLLSFC